MVEYAMFASFTAHEAEFAEVVDVLKQSSSISFADR